jgi:hypothetical protein
MVQGGESNVRHTRRFASWVWGENRPNDAFIHYPHGGRLDSRYRRPNTYNNSVLDPRSSTLTYEPVYSAPLFNQSFANAISIPAVPFSHLLNYDYFKTNRPYVCSCANCRPHLPACKPYSGCCHIMWHTMSSTELPDKLFLHLNVQVVGCNQSIELLQCLTRCGASVFPHMINAAASLVLAPPPFQPRFVDKHPTWEVSEQVILCFMRGLHCW